MHEPKSSSASSVWKQRLGLALVVYSLLPMCSVELVAFLDVTPTEAVVFGAVYLASGEIAFLAAVALLGKQFLLEIKARIKNALARFSRPAPAKPINRVRHTVGITLFILSIVPYYVTIGGLLLVQPKEPNSQAWLALLVAGEALFFLSLFVLGEEFWTRLKHLFEWPGKTQPAPGPASR